MAVGAGLGALAGSLADVGIGDEFTREVREHVTLGIAMLDFHDLTAFPATTQKLA